MYTAGTDSVELHHIFIFISSFLCVVFLFSVVMETAERKVLRGEESVSQS